MVGLLIGGSLLERAEGEDELDRVGGLLIGDSLSEHVKRQDGVGPDTFGMPFSMFRENMQRTCHNPHSFKCYRCSACGLTQPLIKDLFQSPHLGPRFFPVVVGVDHGLHRCHDLAAPDAAADAHRPT